MAVIHPVVGFRSRGGGGGVGLGVGRWGFYCGTQAGGELTLRKTTSLDGIITIGFWMGNGKDPGSCGHQTPGGGPLATGPDAQTPAREPDQWQAGVP